MLPALLTLLLTPTFAKNQDAAKPFPGESRFFQVSKATGNGVVDTSGKEIIPCKYGYMEYVGEDRFIISEPSQQKGLWNTRGERICSIPAWTSMYGNNRFSDGLLLLSGDSNKYQVVYIDKWGKHIVKENTYRTGQPFSNGLAAVSYERREGEYCAYIDSSGKLKLGPFLNASGSSFKHEFALLRVDGKTGFIDKTGRFVLPPEFDHVEWRGEDKWILKKGDKEYTASSIESKISLQPNDIHAKQPLKTNLKVDNALEWSREQFMSANGLLVSEYRAPPGEPFSEHRTKIFYRFLENFDVIGMKRPSLEERLGKGENQKWLTEMPSGSTSLVQYSFSSPGARCGFGSSCLQIAYDSQDRVTGWRIEQGPDRSRWSWNCDNVVALDYSFPAIFTNLIPKQDIHKFMNIRTGILDN